MTALTLSPGLVYYPDYLDRQAQESLLAEVRDIVKAAPLFVPRMPKTDKPFSVRMSNCGPLGWVSDRNGYRYQPRHPATGEPWPPMPQRLLAAWRELSGFPFDPDACLINYYEPSARMGLHQDKDEEELAAPIVSLSLGATALFRYGLTDKPTPTRSVRLRSGDAIAFGGPARLVYHGIDRLYPGTSDLVADDGRINLTLRKVTRS